VSFGMPTASRPIAAWVTEACGCNLDRRHLGELRPRTSPTAPGSMPAPTFEEVMFATPGNSPATDFSEFFSDGLRPHDTSALVSQVEMALTPRGVAGAGTAFPDFAKTDP
jgi:hypothetical protein